MSRPHRFRGLVGVVCAALAGMALAAERTPDGLGLVDALTGTPVSGDPWPFRWSPAALSGGNAGTASGHAIARTLANTWAPECVYQLERWGSTMTATFTNLVPEAPYTLELHLTENFFGGSNGSGGIGNRVWHVAANGTTLEKNIDIFKEAGGAYTALCKQYSVTADAAGRIAVTFTTKTDNAHFSGLALFGAAAPSAPALTVEHPQGTLDLAFSWPASTDVHRYYLERADAAEGPWTGVQTLTPEATSITLTNAYDAAKAVAYRLVASNGVGTAVSDVVSFAPPAGTGRGTRGETIASDAMAFWRLGTVVADSAPANALAADDVSALGYVLDVDAFSPLALAAGQTFRVGTLGVGAAGGTLAVTGAGALAPLDGILNLSVEKGALTVETPVAGGGAATLAKNGAGRATFAGGLEGAARLAVNAGAFAYSNAADGTFAVPLAGAGTFEKMGAGTLTVTKGSPGFAGDVVVREGTLRFGAEGSVYANAQGTLTVEPGAALDVASPDLGNEKVGLGARTVVVSGAGPDGKGAIVNGGGRSQYNALRNGSLAGDVVFGGDSATLSATVGRWDFRSGALALNGHSITKVGSNMVCLTGMKLTTGDTPVTIDVQEGYWSSETSTDYTQGHANTLRVRKGAVFDLYDMTKPVTWTLDLEDGASVRFRYARDDTRNHIASPIVLPSGTVDVTALQDVYGSLGGPISGEGRLRAVSGGGGRISLYGTNTYAGGTWVQGGDLYAAHKDALPGWDDPARLTVTNATLILAADEGAWTAVDATALAGGGQLVGSAWLGVSVKGAPVAWEAALAAPNFAKYDAGTLRLGAAGAFPQGNDLRLAGGMFDGAGQTVTAGVVRVTSGTLRNVRLVCTRLEKTGEGTLEFEQAELVECGSLSLVGGLKSVYRPGLFEDVLSGQDNWTGVIACTNVQSQGPVKANTKEGWEEHTTAVYAGYIWNRTDADVTWSLMESFDDRVRVWIDGALVLANDAWDAASAAAFTLAPGPHRFEARFGQGVGGVGPTSATNIVGGVQPTFGIGLDWEGRTDLLAANFTALANPEVNGGPLFTTAPGALPLADPTATTATLTGPFAFTGTWTVDMAQIRAGGRLAVTDGALDLSTVTEVVFANTEDLKKGGVYVLAESADGFVPGETPPALAGLPAGPWRLEVYGKTLRLAYPASTAIILR